MRCEACHGRGTISVTPSVLTLTDRGRTVLRAMLPEL
jgi:hypothetical protein